MAKYETMMITSAKLDEETSSALVAKFKDLVAANGTIDSVEDWGKRRLAYPIEKQTEGIYTLINFTSEANFPAELDRVYRITEGVMRSLIIAKSDEQIAKEEAVKTAAAERQAKIKADAEARAKEAEVKAAEVKAEEVKAEEVKSEEVKVEEVKVEEVKVEEQEANA